MCVYGDFKDNSIDFVISHYNEVRVYLSALSCHIIRTQTSCYGERWSSHTKTSYNSYTKVILAIITKTWQ